MHHEILRALVSLYHGELAAERSYGRAAQRFAGQPEEAVLQRLELAHAEASQRIAEEIRAAGMVVPEPMGVWETFAETAEAAAGFINDDIALHVLQRGEQIGVHAYEKALASPYVTIALYRLLTDLLNACRGHLRELRGLRAHVLEVQDRPRL